MISNYQSLQSQIKKRESIEADTPLPHRISSFPSLEKHYAKQKQIKTKMNFSSLARLLSRKFSFLTLYFDPLLSQLSFKLNDTKQFSSKITRVRDESQLTSQEQNHTNKTLKTYEYTLIRAHPVVYYIIDIIKLLYNEYDSQSYLFFYEVIRVGIRNIYNNK